MNMGLILMNKCPNCGQVIIDSKEYCINCGKELKLEKHFNFNSKNMFTIMGILIFFGVALVYGIINFNTETELRAFENRPNIMEYLAEKNIDYNMVNTNLTIELTKRELPVVKIDENTDYYITGQNIYVIIDNVEYKVK